MKTKESNICSCWTFSTERRGASLLLTVTLTVSSVTHHSVMSAFLSVLAQDLSSPGTLSASVWDEQIFSPHPRPLVLLLLITVNLPRVSLRSWNAIYETSSLGFSSFFSIYQYSSLSCMFIGSHLLKLKEIKGDTVIWHQPGLDLEEKVICFD